MPDSLTRREINVSLDSFGVLAFCFLFEKSVLTDVKSKNSFCLFRHFKNFNKQSLCFSMQIIITFFSSKTTRKEKWKLKCPPRQAEKLSSVEIPKINGWLKGSCCCFHQLLSSCQFFYLLENLKFLQIKEREVGRKTRSVSLSSSQTEVCSHCNYISSPLKSSFPWKLHPDHHNLIGKLHLQRIGSCYNQKENIFDYMMTWIRETMGIYFVVK